MKEQAGVFQFDLSRAELFWLAGAFGISSLPLPDATIERLTHDQLEQRQKAGHASLLTRGLIRSSPGFGWQIERLPAALVQWISSAPSLLRLERITTDGAVRSLHLFTSDAQGLSLEMDGEIARFIIYQTRRHLQDAIMRGLSLPSKTKKTASVHKLPQPLVFLPTAWKDASLAARILKEHGLDSKSAKSALDWAVSMEWIAALSKVRIEGTGNAITEQFALCGEGKSIWGGKDDGQYMSFAHIGTMAINSKIGDMLE
ncbi:MAG: hypothetical protein B6D38_03625 [Anaerolineae bacterium UTCFX1]|jgi:hypothetical protein|nr:MAG: hypothetical protein B6D38_03625 [Anaerolineae bacterium UTCFX1]